MFMKYVPIQAWGSNINMDIPIPTWNLSHVMHLAFFFFGSNYVNHLYLGFMHLYEIMDMKV
jgi:hypothetical protein